MSSNQAILKALQDAGHRIQSSSDWATQGIVINVDGYDKPLRIYSWNVTDNGRATGTVRPADERRIQALASHRNMFVMDEASDTLVLGWCDQFSDEPVIVAYNPFGIAKRVNSKIQRKIDQGVPSPRASDSQQFRQELIDDAMPSGLKVGQNQHSEYVVVMRPEKFLDYLSNIKPRYHSEHLASTQPTFRGPRRDVSAMDELVAVAEAEEAEPVDEPEEGLVLPFDPAAYEEERERVAREITIRRGQRGFRKKLLRAYDRRCAITGCTVEQALEAAHIVPYKGPGSNHPSNGLLLRADLHTLFDFGLIAIDPSTMTVLVSPSLEGTEYEPLAGLQLRRPTNSAFSPSVEALRRHREIAGL
jgi:HNH endonuclease/Methylase-associated X1